MKSEIATVNGVPLDKVLEEQKSAEIRKHVQAEVSKLTHDLGRRRTRSPRRVGLGRHGRSRKGYSLILMKSLVPYLNDDSLQDEDVADLSSISLKDVRAYRRRSGLRRERHRMGR